VSEPAVAAQTPVDPVALMVTGAYRRLLVMAALIGVLVSVASWAFLEAVHWIDVGVYTDLPKALGFDGAPWWWPFPVLAIAGVVSAVAIYKLPGNGGHVPYLGLGGSPTLPNALPGALLAALASLGLGVVLGPEAPLIALATGLSIFAVKAARKDTPQQALSVLAAAGSFAALATIFGSPVVGAVILIEAAGLGGAMLPLVLLPGLMAAGIGSLMFLGMDSWAGLNSSSYALEPFTLPAFGTPTFAEFAWIAPLGVVTAVVVFGVVELAKVSARVVGRNPWVLLPVAGVVIAGLAVAFYEISGKPTSYVLFSGEDSFSSIFGTSAATLSVGVLVLLLVCKGLAWAISLGGFRGGPTFPAIFIGAVGGLLASHLPGLPETPAVAALMGAATVAMLRLPLSSVILALLLTSKAGITTAPLIIVAVVVAYITVLSLSALRARRTDAKPASAPPQPA
jgi:H+/Cl- antiporter ClcA